MSVRCSCLRLMQCPCGALVLGFRNVRAVLLSYVVAMSVRCSCIRLSQCPCGALVLGCRNVRAVFLS